MNDVDHEALMEEIAGKKRQSMIIIAFVIIAFILYLLFFRSVLRQFF